jgi:hypothetical protein
MRGTVLDKITQNSNDPALLYYYQNAKFKLQFDL